MDDLFEIGNVLKAIDPDFKNLIVMVTSSREEHEFHATVLRCDSQGIRGSNIRFITETRFGQPMWQGSSLEEVVDV